MKIKKGDEIKIISGKDRGKTGKVSKVYPKMNSVLVDGLNMFKKHMRKKQADKKGEIVLVPRPLKVSAIRMVCSNCGKVTRIGYDLSGENKVRICKKCKQAI
jgi:large subunit ribosomal protein L24